MSLFSLSRLAHDDVLDIAGRPVRLRVDARARRVSLRVDPTRRQVVATAPSPRRLAEAVAFARTRADWIAQRLDALPAGSAFAPGQVLQVQGRPCRLERAAMRIVPRLAPETAEEPLRLIASGTGPAYGAAVQRALKAHALILLKKHSAAYAAALGKPMPDVSVMDARARWGSCLQGVAGAPGRIRYSWRLVLASAKALDYVAAHECAHLVEANHGPRFWALVRKLYGDPSPARAWLKTHGPQLHAAGR